MTNVEFQNLIDRYQREECTPDERELVEQWIEAIQSQEIQTAIDYEKKEFELRAQILQAIQQLAMELPKEKIVSTRRADITWVYRAVAAILLISGSLYFLTVTLDKKDQALQKNIAAGTGEKSGGSVQNNGGGIKEVRLSDGSIVCLEPGGRIVIDTDLKKAKERKIRLEGTAFFRVAHDVNRPFRVTTKNLVTKVLGTSFTISAEKGKEERVKVKTGKVAVYCQDRKDQPPADSFVAITANYQIRFDSTSRKLVESIVDHPSLIPTPERRGSLNKSALILDERPKMKFEEVPATEILKALEDAYGIKIRFDESKLSKCIITASMKNDDFYTWLQTVCDLIGGKYQADGNEIEVTGPGCS